MARILALNPPISVFFPQDRAMTLLPMFNMNINPSPMFMIASFHSPKKILLRVVSSAFR